MTSSWEDVCALRTKLYCFLGDCLLESVPDEGTEFLQRAFWEQFPLEAANDKMKSGLDRLVNCTDYLKKLPTSQASQEIQLEFTRLFIGPGQPIAPPWESIYRTPEKLLFGWPALQVREAYRLEGFEIKCKYQMPEDHMGLELMFLASASDALAKTISNDNQSTIPLMIERHVDFISNHPLTWIEDFMNDVSASDSIGFYSGLIELIWGVLLWDLELLQEMLLDFQPE